MKLLKKNTNTKTINEAFKVGDAVKWIQSSLMVECAINYSLLVS